MVQSGDHFDEFQPHSRHKHLVFRAYFEAWGRKLLLRRGAGDRVCVVDACAGRGHDNAGNPGSPLIAARAAAEAQAQLESEFRRAVRIDVVAIEKDPQYFQELQKYLGPFGDTVRVLPGTLADHLDDLVRELGDAPTLFFIDPFGLEALKADVVRRALTPERNEALLLFADQAALRHFGAVQSLETEAVRALRRHEANPGLFADLFATEHQQLAHRARRSQAAQEVGRKRSKEILDDAFGDMDWQRAMDQTPKHLQRRKFLELYQDFLRSCGAYHTLEIPILNADGGHVYFLLHASKSLKGYRTMKESVDHALRKSPLPPEVVDGMKELLRSDLASIERQLREHFAGKTVRWAKDKDDSERPSLKEYVLERTAAHPFELKELQERLRAERQPGRTTYYRFSET